MPCSQTFLFSWGSTRTSEVPYANHEVSEHSFDGVFHVVWFDMGPIGVVGSWVQNFGIGSRGTSKTYHGLESESLDLLDGTGSALLEGNAVELQSENCQHCYAMLPDHHRGPLNSLSTAASFFLSSGKY